MIRLNLQWFAGEKTERATPKRRGEAKQKGSLPRSSELTSAIAFFGLVIGMKILGSYIWTHLYNDMYSSLSHVTTNPLTANDVQSLLVGGALKIVYIVLPVVGIALIAGLVTSYAQVGVYFSPQLLIPDFSRISPLGGLRRLFSMRGSVEALKSILKLSLIGILAYTTVQSVEGQVMQLSSVDITGLPSMVGGIVYRLAIEIGVAMLVLSVADFLFQRYSFEKGIRMSKDEIKEEHKQQEGNPMVKGEVRKRGRKIAFSRMMQEVPKADVIITNPTHFAVALKYEAGKMSAPVVLAKGQDEIAKRIRAAATDAMVPIVENRPLARALYASVEIGQVVPKDLFKAVAEVLAYVYRLRENRKRR